MLFIYKSLSAKRLAAPSFEKLIPLQNVMKNSLGLKMMSGGMELKIPKQILHERIVSIVKSGNALYVKLLKF